MNDPLQRLRSAYRGTLTGGERLQADPILIDEAQAAHNRLANSDEQKARLWAAIWVYEMIISPDYHLRYLKWKAIDGDGYEYAELLGDFETRRVETDGHGHPVRWADMADVTWEDGDRCVLADQPVVVVDAIMQGAMAVEPDDFLSLWRLALETRPPGVPNPRLSAEVLATFEELRIARGEE